MTSLIGVKILTLTLRSKVDSNRNEQNILYKDEFNEWVNTNKNLKIVFANDYQEHSLQTAREITDRYLESHKEIRTFP
jgi:hypothetical protein